MRRPLEGYRVIEFANYVAGPAASRVLGDWGAEIIKVESYAGDNYRTNKFIYGMPQETDLEDPCFDVVAVNKRFMAMDLRTPEGKEIFDKLLERADVLLTNTRKQSLERLGYTYDQIKDRFPRLIYAHMLGYGEKGALRNRAGFDYTCYGGRGGITGSLYEKGGAPMVPGPGFGDLQAGMCLSSGILAALLAREKTGKGDRVVVSLHGVGVYMLHLLHSSRQDGYEFPISREFAPTPTNNTYQTKDGRWIFIAVPDYNGDYNRFVTAIGREDLMDNPLYNNIATLRANGHLHEFIEIIEEQFAQKTISEWRTILEENDIAGEVCMISSEVLEDSECWDNEFIQKYTYPTGNERTVFNNPIRFDSLGVPEYHPSKGIGADTEAILEEIGYSQTEIKAFEESGAVRQHR